MKKRILVGIAITVLSSCTVYKVTSIDGGYPFRNVVIAKLKSGDTRTVKMQAADVKSMKLKVNDRVYRMGKRCLKPVKKSDK